MSGGLKNMFEWHNNFNEWDETPPKAENKILGTISTVAGVIVFANLVAILIAAAIVAIGLLV